jgi:hypothetical protein
VDLYPIINISSPKVGTKIQRSSGLTIMWEQAIQYPTSDVVAEVRIYNLDEYTKTGRTSNDTYTDSFVIAKTIPQGAKSIDFSPQDLSSMKGNCSIGIFLASAKTVKTTVNSKSLKVSALSGSESFVEVRIE